MTRIFYSLRAGGFTGCEFFFGFCSRPRSEGDGLDSTDTRPCCNASDVSLLERVGKGKRQLTCPIAPLPNFGLLIVDFAIVLH